ncbi:MAG: CdvA-like protein, partial [Crenarchaeota archaeon]|nr:CdvA-like protein [Thermoproteota archaeon]MDW8034366.1 CdvA-like protein [Nitrososphaerota archaeon]
EEAVKTINIYSKKIQTLRSLKESGKISEKTADFLQKEFDNYVKTIEARKQTVLEKLENRIKEVQQQMEVIEKLIANNEIRFSAQEISEDRYTKIATALNYALEETRNEYESLREAISILTRLPELISQSETVER